VILGKLSFFLKYRFLDNQFKWFYTMVFSKKRFWRR